MSSTLRFAAGDKARPFSSIWHLATSGDDVYLGASAATMGLMKFSLHASGVWVFAATQQSGMAFEGGNRRAMRWTRPAEFYPGWTRGPSIAVPHIEEPHRPPNASRKQIVWVAGPPPGHFLDFAIYLAAPGVPAPTWTADDAPVGDRTLRGGGRVFVVSAYRPMLANAELNVEWMVGSTVVGADPALLVEGSFLWLTESRDQFRVPLVIDLPVNAATSNPNSVIAAADPLAVTRARPSTLAEWRASLERRA